MTGTPRRVEAGFGLVGALAGITMMLILMAVAVPAWKYVMQDDREEELIFRGSAIADAIARCQRETKAMPVSLEFLVQKKFLRKAYKDPMSKDGRWRLIHPGEPIPPPLPTGAVEGGSRKSGSEPEEGRSSGGSRGREGGLQAGSPSGFGSGGAMSVGPILGVASRNRGKALRLFNGRSHYHEWIFTVGMPRIVGKMPSVMPAPGTGPGGAGQRPVGGAPKR